MNNFRVVKSPVLQIDFNSAYLYGNQLQRLQPVNQAVAYLASPTSKEEYFKENKNILYTSKSFQLLT
jgi:hypothetical protein